jgi:hypothetical protein
MIDQTSPKAAQPPTGSPEILDIDPELISIFGPPPLCHGERREDYERLWGQLRQHIRPTTIIEEMLVRNLADLTWEIRRGRSIQAGLMDVASGVGLHRIMEVIAPAQPNGLAAKAVAGDFESKKAVTELLKRAGLGPNALKAEGFVSRLTAFDRLDLILTRLEVRQNAVLKELDRHRDVLGRRAREAMDIVDIEPVPPAIQARPNGIESKDSR